MGQDQPKGDARMFRRLITGRGTVLYIDPGTGWLVQGRPYAVEADVRLHMRGDTAMLVHRRDGTDIPVQCAAAPPFLTSANTALPPTRFAVAWHDGGGFSLQAHGHFLTALPDGRMSLSAAACGTLETFTATPADRPPRIAAFTMAFNEAAFLPLWLDYYGAQLGRENLYVLDHGSTDGSTQDLAPTSVVHVPRAERFDEDQRAAFVSRFQASLLCYHDIVIFSDTDEFLVPHPSLFTDLRDYAGQRCDRAVTAVGLDVVHRPDIEPPLDLSRPVLAQRGFAQFRAEYCKTLVSRIPLEWAPGFHCCQIAPRVDPDLFLFHLKRADRDLALAALRRFRVLAWSQSGLAQGHSHQMRMDEGEFLARMFPPVDAVADEFDFRADIARLPTAPYEAHYDSGAIVRLADEFRAVRIGGASLSPRRQGPAQTSAKDEP